MVAADNRKYFFVHLHKTAGTSMWNALKRQFSESEMYPARSDSTIPNVTISVDHLVARWPERRDEVSLVAGHFPLCTREVLGEDFVTFSTLREPVERVLSTLRRQRQRVPDFRETPLEEIYRHPVKRVMMRNHMVKMFSLTPATMTRGLLTPIDFTREHLDRAKEQLESIDAVGFQEQFDTFLADLSDRFGWDLGPAAMANRSEPMEVPDSLRDLLAEDNALDVEFYDYARRRFAATDGDQTRNGV